jgi:hypothetical protein
LQNQRPGKEGLLPVSGPAGSDDRRVKVLYITGWGRSGSTILGRVLGQVKDFFLVGELRYIWDRGFIENRLCSCGVPFRECPVWRSVTARAFGDGFGVDAKGLVSLRERGVRTRHLALAPSLRSLRAKLEGMESYLQASEALYHAARDVSRSEVIVDTSKFPSYGFVLRNLPSIDLYVLHLVRDPRAVAYSWESRRKAKPDHGGISKKLMTPHGFAESSLVWNEWNLATENLRRHDPDRYMLLRYEDFVRSPRESVGDILRFLGAESAELPFADEHEVRLEVPHTFSGNPDRFQSGNITIKPDESWRGKMSAPRLAAVTALTWPGLLRYNYPIWPQRHGSPRHD